MTPETQTLLDLTFYPPNEIPAEAQQKTLDFWANESAVSADVARTRVKQVIAHACIDGRLVGVASGLVGLSQILDQPYFYYRSYVAAAERRQGIGQQLLEFGFDALSKHFKAQPRPRAIGLLLEIPPDIAPLNHHLIWPKTKFIFTGQLPNGGHQRVRYFEQVTLFDRAQ